MHCKNNQLQDARNTFFKEAYTIVPQLNKLSKTEQLLYLIKAHDSNLINLFAAYVHYVLSYFNW